MLHTTRSSIIHTGLPLRSRHALLTFCGVFTLVLFYFAANVFGILPDSWVETDAHKAVFGTINGQYEGDLVDVWRETRYVGGVAGVTLWENIYLHNGTFYVLSPEPVSAFPDSGYIMSAHPTADDQRLPAGPDRWRVVTRLEARNIMRSKAISMDGNSFFFNDESSPNMSSFLGHYYHFAEVFLSAWRLVTSAYGSSASEFPTRIMFRVTPGEWQDGAGLITWLHKALIPRAKVEDERRWVERAESGRTYLFEKFIIVDRFAAHQHGGPDIRKWNSMTMDLLDLKVPTTWMDPLISALTSYVEAGLLGGCKARRRGDAPVVTYINRQKTGRKLRPQDADSLDIELDKLAKRGEIELYNQFFEDIPPDKQFCLILKTDILLGVHGNGLTHQMWMKPGSAVVEVMGQEGFAITYAWLAKVMGHQYSAVHYDHVFPETQWIQPNGSPLGQEGDFHSDRIRVSGPFVASLVEKLARDRRQSLS